jgi:cob(I)alamin adenosyltransferase
MTASLRYHRVMPRLTKIYTRKGDQGFTSLGDKQVAKDDLLIEALGSVDELNSSIGLILANLKNQPDVDACLTRVQNDLFDLGGELHLPERVVITEDKITWLEQQLDQWNSTLPTLKEFILPRGNPAAASTHLARTICRRAERAMVRLHRQVPISNTEMLRYLNRLSDVLFVVARILARSTDANEKMWEHEK